MKSDFLAQLPHRAKHIAMGPWGFPLVVVLLLILLTAFKISGTSAGQYHQLLYGKTSKDSALIAGQPRAIRSDEWGVNTPLTVAQAKEGFPVISKSTAHGQDIAITFDIPYKEWSTLFKPQNWSFFVMPLEYAFAFKWWFLSAALLLACYAFTLTVLPKKYLIAALVSVALLFSPFLQWWYQTGSLLSIAYTLAITTLVLRLLKPVTDRRLFIAKLGALTYVLTCFAFILYVPFLVPLALAAAAFIAGHLVNEWLAAPAKKKYLLRISWLALPIVVTGCLLVLFMQQHSAVIQALSGSIYPGDRTDPSGGFSWLQLFGGYYNIQLQQDTAASHFSLNQSEASNFILLFPLLLPLLLYICNRKKQGKFAIDWRVGLLLVLALGFALRLFVPASEFIFNALQLNRIPHNRLLIGMGLLNLYLIILSLEYLYKRTFALPKRLQWTSIALAFAVPLVVGIGLKLRFDGYLESIVEIVLISAIIAIIVWLMVTKHLVRALGIFALFSMLASMHVNPLYRGLGIITHSKISHAIASTGRQKNEWVVGDYAAAFETFPAANGKSALSGVYAYPQLGIWKGVGADSASQAVYNRYAHVFFSVGTLPQKAQGDGAYFDPPALDAFRVHAGSCSTFLRNQHVRYVLMSEPLVGGCARQIKTITYPLMTFRVYQLESANP